MAATAGRTAGTTARAGDAGLMQQVSAGVAGGLVGGVAFGLMMQMMGMIGMIAMLVGSSSPAVGWIVHLLISAFFGAAFGALLGRMVKGMGSGALLGAGYGVTLWVLGALVLMPARLGMPLFMINGMSMNSLLGHVVFGVLLGAVTVLILRRRA